MQFVFALGSGLSRILAAGDDEYELTPFERLALAAVEEQGAEWLALAWRSCATGCRASTGRRPATAGSLTAFLRAVADALEEVSVDAGDVMNAHWLPYADRALFSRFFLAQRRGLELPPVKLDDKKDREELERYPHVHDLARLAALLPLPPWQELLPRSDGKPAQRETAEAYRRRIRRIVALYQNGLGTTDALRSIVEAQLSVDSRPTPSDAIAASRSRSSRRSGTARSTSRSAACRPISSGR